jgi:hypothetical protein
MCRVREQRGTASDQTNAYYIPTRQSKKKLNKKNRNGKRNEEEKSSTKKKEEKKWSILSILTRAAMYIQSAWE